MPSLCRSVWISPARGCSIAEICPWKTAPTLDGFLDQVLEDADAQLEALERGRVLLLDGAALRSRGQASAQPEGPVQLSLNLAGFSPEDVAVQLDGRRLKVTARRKTERRAPDGCCSRECREVYREVLLPDDADLEALACVLSAEGRLRIEAPRLPLQEKVVPIHRVEEADGQGGQTENGEEAAGGEEKEAEGAE